MKVALIRLCTLISVALFVLTGCGGGGSSGRSIAEADFQKGVQTALDSGGVNAAASWVSANLAAGDTIIEDNKDIVVTDIDVFDHQRRQIRQGTVTPPKVRENE